MVKNEKNVNNKLYIIGGIVLLVIAFVVAIVSYSNYKNLVKNPIDFISVDGEETYSKIDVSLMSYSITDVYSSDTYHIVGDGVYSYIVKVDFDTWDELKEIREYTYSSGVARAPEAITVYGMPRLIEEDIKSDAIKTLNDMGMGANLSYSNFDDYFGTYYLDTTLNPLSDSLVVLAFIISMILTVGIVLIVCYLKGFKDKKLIIFSTLFLAFSWILIFALDFRNDTIILTCFYFIALATIVWIYSIVKLTKNKPSNVEKKSVQKSNNTIKVENNIYEGKSKEKILQTIYENYDKFMNEYGYFLLFFSGWDEAWRLEKDENKKLWYSDTAKEEFVSSLFIKILLNSNDKEKKKTLTFLNNLDSDIVEELDTTYQLDNTKMQEAILEDNKKSYQVDYASIDFNKWLKFAFNKLAFMRNSEWKLKEDIWKDFILDIQNAYNAYVNPETPIDLLGQYGKTSVQNETDSSNKALYMFYLPIVLIIIMVIKFLTELFGEGGIITSGGWWSVAVFVILIIWTSVGSSGKYNTCSNCKKWNSLKLERDIIIDSRETFRTKTKTTSNGKSYNVQVAVRIDRHEEHYTCQHCGNKEVKYRDREYEL